MENSSVQWYYLSLGICFCAETFSSTIIIETNLQLVNDIYLNTVANHILTFGISQSDIEDIAAQCPFESGIAVFKARGLLKILDPLMHWDDESLCTISPKESDSGEIISGKVKIFPNPTEGIVTVAYNFLDDSDREFELQDVAGRMVFRIILPADGQQVTFDVGSIISGLYFYKISSEDHELNYTGKLTVIH